MSHRTIAFVAAAVLAAASTADAARYTWTQMATEDQVNNAPTGDGSTDSGATGPSTITYDSHSDVLAYDIEWIGLENDLSAIHVHGPSSAPESTMSILFSVYFDEQEVLDAAVDRRNDSAVDATTLEEASEISDLDADGVLAAMLADDGYVNTHSTFWPMGEIRANLVLTESLLEQTKAQQKCTNAMFKGTSKLSSLTAKVVAKCIKAKTKGKLGGTLTECLGDNAGATASTVAKITDDFASKCSGDGLPTFGLELPDAATAINDGVPTAATGAFAASFDDAFSLDDGIVDDTMPDVGGCQAALAKGIGKCLSALHKEFSKCLKSGLAGKGDALFEDSAEVTTCIGADAKGKIAKACDATTGAVRKAIDKKCVGVDLAVALEGCGTSDAATAASCAEDRAQCSACLAEQLTGDLTFDCDVYDDGAANGTCVISGG